jgi:hypothetical protein
MMLRSDMAEAPTDAGAAQAAVPPVAEEGIAADSGAVSPRPDRRTARNAQGNEVPVEDRDAERSEAGKADAQTVEARQIEAQQIGAEPQESPPAPELGPGQGPEQGPGQGPGHAQQQHVMSSKQEVILDE